MKIRKGFVSNSSSSSFIVGFDKVPETVEELKHMLFGDSSTIEYYDYQMTADAAAKTVFDDMKNCINLDEDLKYEFSGEYYADTWGASIELSPSGVLHYINSSDKEELMKILRKEKKVKDDFSDVCIVLRNEFEKKEGKSPKYKEPGYYEFSDKLQIFMENDLKYNREEYNESMKSFREKKDTLMNKIIDEDFENFKNLYKDKKFYVFTYSDNDGNNYSILEHGDIFDNLFHIRISKH